MKNISVLLYVLISMYWYNMLWYNNDNNDNNKVLIVYDIKCFVIWYDVNIFIYYFMIWLLWY